MQCCKLAFQTEINNNHSIMNFYASKTAFHVFATVLYSWTEHFITLILPLFAHDYQQTVGGEA